jgi:hypothetical protein
VFSVAVALGAVGLLGGAGGEEAAPGRARLVEWLVIVVFLLSLGGSLSSAVNQDWFVRGRDRIWWRLKEQSPLAQLHDTAMKIRSLAPPGSLLLTQDPYLAVESGMKLPRGLEMGQFSYFPEFDDERAERLHVMNRSRLTALIRECPAPIAALSGYSFAISSPGIEPVSPEEETGFWSEVDGRYDLLFEVPYFGQAFTTLRVFGIKK